jgi:SulP family sulfate permease
VTAIIAGIVAGIFGGSHLQVSGPTGAMTVVLVPIVERYGPGAVYTLAILAGVVVVGMGLARLGRAVMYLPWPVIEGFTVGIATVIALQQVPLALDVIKPAGENTAVVAFETLLLADNQRSLIAAALVAFVIIVMIITMKIRHSLPASLISVVIATIVAEVLHLDTSRIGELPAALPQFSVPALDITTIRALLSSAIAVAALAAIESLLSARVADGMSDESKSEPDRELVGQGLANIASGFFGGMPATGAIARTAVNVRSGARTRLSSIFHSVVLVVAILVGSSLLSKIPLAALAGVLFVTAYRMVERRTVFALLKSSRNDAGVFLVTAIATVALDLIIAVEIGIALAAALALRALASSSSVHTESIREDSINNDTESELLHQHIGIYRLDGALFFGAAQRFLDDLTDDLHIKVMILRLDRVNLLDATGAQTLNEVIEDLQSRGVTVLLKGVQDRHRTTLDAVGTFNLLANPQHNFALLPEAIEEARNIVRTQLT